MADTRPSGMPAASSRMWSAATAPQRASAWQSPGQWNTFARGFMATSSTCSRTTQPFSISLEAQRPAAPTGNTIGGSLSYKVTTSPPRTRLVKTTWSRTRCPAATPFVSQLPLYFWAMTSRFTTGRPISLDFPSARTRMVTLWLHLAPWQLACCQSRSLTGHMSSTLAASWQSASPWLPIFHQSAFHHQILHPCKPPWTEPRPSLPRLVTTSLSCRTFGPVPSTALTVPGYRAFSTRASLATFRHHLAHDSHPWCCAHQHHQPFLPCATSRAPS